MVCAFISRKKKSKGEEHKNKKTPFEWKVHFLRNQDHTPKLQQEWGHCGDRTRIRIQSYPSFSAFSPLRPLLILPLLLFLLSFSLLLPSFIIIF